VARERQVYLSSLDPLASYTLIYDYLSSNNSGNLYRQYEFSYITNTFKQFANLFGDIFPYHESIGQHIKKYYTGGEYGLAFSMVLESILNFWYFGPIIIGIALNRVLAALTPFILKYGKVFEIFFITGVLLLIRTEMAVFLKLQ